MTCVDSVSAVHGEVVRHIYTYNANGVVVETTRQVIVPTHWVDVQPLELDDQIISGQLKFPATHEIYPEPDVIESISIGDYYRVGTKEYKIIDRQDFRDVGFFCVIKES